MNKTWTESIREEIISALWLIAGLLAWIAGIKILACMLFIKSFLDCLASFIYAIKEAQKEKFDKETPK